MARMLLRTGLAFIGAVALMGTVSVFAAETYELDKVHSSIGFSVSHMMVSKVTGGFTDYDSTIRFAADDLANSKIDFNVKPASIDTRNQMRDDHLKGGDFFEAAKYPEIIFKSKKIEPQGENKYLVTGDLTIKSVTKEVQVPITLLGPVENPMKPGEIIIGLEAEFPLNRQDYGVSFNKKMDNGGLLVGDIVDLQVNIEAHGAQK